MAKGRILAIDNEKFYQRFYRNLLEEQGYELTVTDGPAAGLAALGVQPYDLVIADIRLPGLEGPALVDAIRKQAPQQEILAVCELQDVNIAIQAVKLGIFGYMLKPLNAEELLLQIDRCLFRQSVNREHRKLLEENLEFHALLSQYNRCLALLQVDDLDRFGDLLLDTLMELLVAEGGILWLSEGEGEQYRFRSRRGLGRLRPGEELITPGSGDERMMHAGRAVLLQDGRILVLPVCHEGKVLAMVRIETPTGRRKFSPRDQRIADFVADFAACSLQHILRIRELERGSLRAADRDVYNMAFFRDYAERELYKARRYNRKLSFVRLVIDNHARLKGRFHDRDMATVQSQMIKLVNGVLRDADIMALHSDDSFYILLPETDYWGSLVMQRRLRQALSGQLRIGDMHKDAQFDVYLRSAAFPVDGTTLEDLERVADRRMERLRTSLFYRSDLQSLPFWPVVEKILGPPDSLLAGERLRVPAAQKRFETSGRSCYGLMPRSRLVEILRAFCREVTESPLVRGVIYCGCSDFDALRGSLRSLREIEQTATSFFLLGGNKRVEWEMQRVMPIFIDEPVFRQTTFLLYLNEDYAYALFARPTAEGLVGFHTSDFYFVENMIARLQEQYQLRAQV
jgi:diguanylate cyclase (GGDEF)-like protein